MKTKPTNRLILISVLGLMAFAMTASGVDETKQAIKVMPGSKGGKIIQVEGGHAEFLIQADRKISVRFYGVDLKPVAPAGQVISVTAQAPAGNTKLELEKTAEAFVSQASLPEGEGYMLVLQIRSGAGAKPQNFRIKLDLAHCSGCKRSEYACVCEGHNH
jgi:hypothetical protein